jgi:hypothetical protein
LSVMKVLLNCCSSELSRSQKLNTGVGYERTELRAKTIRTWLGSQPLTPYFGRELLKLTHQIFALLLPFDKAQRSEQMRLQNQGRHGFIPGTHHYEPTECLQAIHDMVGLAAYLSICIRLSPTIIYIRSEEPGNLFEEDDQFVVDYQLYLDSKARVAEVQEKEKLLHMGAPSEGQVKQPFYSALVKMAVWPSFKRYSPGNGKKGGERAGFRVYDIFQAGVVYYWAPRDRRKRYSHGLSTYLGEVRAEEEGVGQWLKKKLSFGYLT